MSGNNTYKRLNDHEIEINGVIYTDGGGAPTNGNDPLYPTESTPPTGTGAEGSATPPSYIYTPGSAAPTDGDPLSYAGWLQGSTKYQAEQDRIRKEQQAQTDRQRQIVDANSAYMQGRALYGANAERMASMGLANSGYGEYLTGKAYATQRGEVQNANRTAQQRIDQAYYEERKIQQQADAKYAEDLIGIKNQQNTSYGALYDSAINGASIDSIMQDSRWATLTPEQQSVIRGATVSNSIKAALDSGKTLDEIKTNAVYGWDGLTVDQQNALTTYYNGIETQNNADYAALYDSALKGASIESIMQDSRWGGLSPEKQATITSVTTANSIKIRIDNGESLETIMADPASGWNDLTVDQQNTLNTYSTTKTEAKNAEIASNFDSYLKAINNGSATLADIQALPGWADMVGTDYETQLQAAWNKREKGNKFNELLRNVQNGDLTAETLEKHADWALMDESERDQLLDVAKSREHGNKFNELLRNIQNGDLTEETLKQHADWAGMSETEKDQLLDAAEAYAAEKNTNAEENVATLRTNMSAYNNLAELRNSQAYKNIVDDTIKKQIEAEFVDMVAEDYSDGSKTKAQVESSLNLAGYSEDDITKIILKWQDNNLDAMIEAGLTYSLSEVNDLISEGYLKEDAKTKLNIVGGKVEGSEVIDYTGQYENGKINSTDYIEKMNNPSFGYNDSPDWSIGGLGNGQGFLGIGGDHFTLYVGSSSNPEDGTGGFSLTTGDKVTDEAVIKDLNKLATGSGDATPNIDGEGAGHRGKDVNSNAKPGRVVVYNGKLYIYTKKGWRSVISRNSNVNDATAAFIAASNK